MFGGDILGGVGHSIPRHRLYFFILARYNIMRAEKDRKSQPMPIIYI